MAKYKDRAEAKALKASTKEELEVAKAELKEVRKTHSIAKDDDGSKLEGKAKKAFDKASATVAKKQATLAEIKEWLDANPEKKEPKIRETIYDYPEGATADEKKKFRAKARAEKKAAEKKAAKGEKGDAPKKDKKKKEEPAEPAKKSKAERKAEKKAAKAEKSEEPAED